MQQQRDTPAKSSPDVDVQLQLFAGLVDCGCVSSSLPSGAVPLAVTAASAPADSSSSSSSTSPSAQSSSSSSSSSAAVKGGSSSSLPVVLRWISLSSSRCVTTPGSGARKDHRPWFSPVVVVTTNEADDGSSAATRAGGAVPASTAASIDSAVAVPEPTASASPTAAVPPAIVSSSSPTPPSASGSGVASSAHPQPRLDHATRLLRTSLPDGVRAYPRAAGAVVVPVTCGFSGEVVVRVYDSDKHGVWELLFRCVRVPCVCVYRVRLSSANTTPGDAESTLVVCGHEGGGVAFVSSQLHPPLRPVLQLSRRGRVVGLVHCPNACPRARQAWLSRRPRRLCLRDVVGDRANQRE